MRSRYIRTASEDGTTEVRRRVGETKQPCVPKRIAANAKLLLVDGLGTIDNRLICKKSLLVCDQMSRHGPPDLPIP